MTGEDRMDPCVMAAQLLAQCATTPLAEANVQPPAAVTAESANPPPPAPTARPAWPATDTEPNATMGHSRPDGAIRRSMSSTLSPSSVNASTITTPQSSPPQFSRPSTVATAPASNWQWGPRPTNGNQFYQFRFASLQAGEMYTRTSPSRYVTEWQSASTAVSYGQWKSLLAREAAVMAQAQGNNRLTVVVGDSLGLWLPAEYLPRNRFWLNQSISGETTSQILQRLNYFDATRPDTIHLMAGINDLKNGASDAEIVQNMHQILTHLRQQHPQARVIVHSILPTRLGNLPSDRIRRVNDYIAYVANQQGATFVDLQPDFTDPQGQLRRELTTDGIHLSPQGYQVWQGALLSY